MIDQAVAISVQKHNSQVTKNCEVMKGLISVVLYMGEQGVAFCGHNECLKRGHFIDLVNARSFRPIEREENAIVVQVNWAGPVYMYIFLVPNIRCL